MLLAVDVGNTNMVVGIFENGTCTGSFRLMTDSNRTSDEIGLLIWKYFQRFKLSTKDVENVIISSVVPQVMHTLSNAFVKYFDTTPIVIDDDVDPGLPYGVSGDEHLGADRSVGCVAAIHKYGAPLIVLDFGTATKVDAVSRDGLYMGGCIMPGIRIATDALFQKAAMLPRVELIKPDTALGNTAVSQVRAGAVLGNIGATKFLVQMAKEEIGEPSAKVIATGGLAHLVADNTDVIDIVDSGLILDGLSIIYERYRKEHQKEQ